VKEIGATEASRHFSTLLDAVEHRGERFVISRNGRPVARIEPAASATFGDFVEILHRHPVDEAWADELRDLRASMPVQWRD
jgi:prevent-host-death family protein